MDYAEIQYKDDLRFNGSQMNFRDFSLASGTNTNYGFSISNTGNLEQVWDVTDITNANRRVNKAPEAEILISDILLLILISIMNLLLLEPTLLFHLNL
ncbi:hypothetical protein [Chryseobacterium indoltheticum]|uniref:hypothetical protein n=1 Tax=Chryseobacterium indoltheticum TaxID=254 RepID=UPI003F496266